MNELEKQQMVILMKNGLTFWVSKETGERAQEQLVRQSAHSFMKIREINETINTAEIAGVHTPQTYSDLKRFTAGEYKCGYGVWHTKRDICNCQAQSLKKAKEREEKIEREPLTEKEQEIRIENFKITEEMGVLDNPSSMFRSRFQKGNKGSRGIRRSTILSWQKSSRREPDIEGLLIDEDIL